MNHRGPGRPLAQEHMERQEFAGGPYRISRLTVMAKAPGDRRRSRDGPQAVAAPDDAHREVGNAEDW